MSRFFRDLFRFIGRYRRGLFVTLLVALGAWCVLLVVAYRLSTRTEFCDSCHFEEPYVESWRTSSHADVDCQRCHAPQGFGGTVDRAYAAVTATLKYWTGTHDKIPRAEVGDANCVQSDCHDQRLIAGDVEFVQGITFDHTHHFGDRVRGMSLRCTSCHSQIVQGAHMEVTSQTCYLCHFKNLPRGEAISGCLCHGAPEGIVVREGFEFRHAQYITLGVVCEDCHVNVVEGDGRVPKARCASCHNPRLEAYDDTGFLHKKHVTEHSVDCASCHEPMTHRNVEMVRSLESSCERCHGGTHTPQRDMFMGIGARGVDPYPSIMFKAQVGCEGCHGGRRVVGAHGEVISEARGEMCIMCHGQGFDAILEEWRESVREYFSRVGPLRKAAGVAFGRVSEDRRARVREVYDRAQQNLAFLEAGHGEHNLVYAKLIFLKVQEDLVDALEELGAPWTAAEPLAFSDDDLRGNCTASCHANLRKTKHVAYQGIELTHYDHVYKHNLPCTFCHDNTEVHGQVKLQRENCLACHHTQETAVCTDCHQTQQRMIAGKGAIGIAETAASMADLSCEDCHVSLRGGNDRQATLEACVGCHEAGYDAKVDEWQAATRARLAALDGKLETLVQLSLTAQSRGVTVPDASRAEKLETEARSYLDIVRNDRSMGVHNVEFAELLLGRAAGKLDEAEALLREPAP